MVDVSKLDELISSNKSVLFQDNSTSKINIIYLDDSTFFYKYKSNKPLHFLDGLRKFYRHIAHNFSPLNHVAFDQSDRFVKEKSTLDRWDSLKIPVIKPIHYSNDSLIFPFVEFPSVQTLLNEEPNLKIFDKTLETYFSIRELALTSDDPYIFHTDCHLNNFLFDKSTEISFPIDPAVCVKNDLSMRELDAYLNSFFTYGLFRLNDNEFSKHLASLFIDNLSSIDKRYFLKIHKPLSFSQKSFWFLRQEALSYLKENFIEPNNPLNLYSDKNYHFINSLLNS